MFQSILDRRGKSFSLARLVLFIMSNHPAYAGFEAAGTEGQ